MHKVLLLAIDLVLLLFANAITVFLSMGSNPDASFEIIRYCGLTVAIAVPALLMTGLNKTLWRFTSLHDCSRVVAAMLMTVAGTAVVASMLSYSHGVPQYLIGQQFVLMTAALIAIRALTRLRHSGRNQRRAREGASDREDILIVGVNAITGFLLRCVAENRDSNIAVAGLLSENRRHRGRLLGSHAVLGRPDEIVKIVHELDVHGVNVNRIILAKSFDKLSATAQNALLQAKNELNLRIDILDDRFGFDATAMPSKIPATPTSNGSETKPFALDTEPRPYLRWKRIFDIAAGISIGICVAPVMIIISALVYFDVGHPVIFWQQRPGARRRPIRVLKFRTMRGARSSDGVLLPDAQRVSSIGKFLRRIRLDELPQIYNVIVGEMSIVGPRPLLPIDQSQNIRGRPDMKPGLTGWAQIKGGRHLSVDDKAALDLWYARNASFRLDLQILLTTARIILFGERIDQNAIHEAWLALGLSPQGTAAKRGPDLIIQKQNVRWTRSLGMQHSEPSTENAQP